ncbi:MAG: DUF3179 domain-containing protein [Opitutus sp.]|nr:DUF3179 domain-containing protein [Opitutus sp.]
MKTFRWLALGLLGGLDARPAEPAGVKPPIDSSVFFQLLDRDDPVRQARARKEIAARWDPGFVAPLVEIATLGLDESIFDLLQRGTGEIHGDDLPAWYDYLWKRADRAPAFYSDFKAAFYGLIDPRFREYFSNRPAATIRLDEIRWGGVRRDGIPPLKNPAMIPAAAAGYLKDSNVVFGVTIDGDSRAYPKRILGWHEMVKDRIGGVEINGVYCTLCGSMIVYRTEIAGRHHELGTSGFLYRSNKLMYDHDTKSLWSTLSGEPVVGPLVGHGLKLAPLHVVTTTWGEWRRRHPDTQVLSLETGHKRDYGEGVAYREYFATDALMFSVPQLDRRLKNKEEVLALRFGGEAARPAAISAAFLRRNPVFHSRLGSQEYVVLTDASGANRVFQTGGRKFAAAPGDAVRDELGGRWRVTEPALVGETGEDLPRLPSHRAFWFGWFSAFPGTELIK